MKRACLISIIVLIATPLVVAQTVQQPRLAGQTSKAEPESDATISFDAALVNTHVSVRDAQGHFVSGLTSRASIEQAIEMAVRNNVTAYAIRLPGENSLNARDQQGRPLLAQISETTGGHPFYFDSGAGQLAGIFNELQDELRSQYSLGYQFQSPSSASRFHKITIKLRQPALKAFTRSGYYSRSE